MTVLLFIFSNGSQGKAPHSILSERLDFIVFSSIVYGGHSHLNFNKDRDKDKDKDISLTSRLSNAIKVFLIGCSMGGDQSQKDT